MSLLYEVLSENMMLTRRFNAIGRKVDQEDGS